MLSEPFELVYPSLDVPLREGVVAVGQARVAMGIDAPWQFNLCPEIEHRHWAEQCSVPLAS